MKLAGAQRDRWDNARRSANYDESSQAGYEPVTTHADFERSTDSRLRRDPHRTPGSRFIGGPYTGRHVACELVARYLSLVTILRTFASLEETNSARARRSPLVSPILEKLQINHFVGSHCHGFTPLR